MAARSRARAAEGKAKPRSDAYVGLLGLSLLAMSAAILFGYLNWDTMKDAPKAVQAAPKSGGGAIPGPIGPGVNPAPARPAGAPGVPPAPPPAGNPAPQKK